MRSRILKESRDHFSYEYENRLLYSLCGLITLSVLIVSFLVIFTTPVSWGLIFVPIGLLVSFILFFLPKTIISIDVKARKFEKCRILRLFKKIKVTEIPVERIDMVYVLEIGDTKSLVVWLDDIEMITIYRTSRMKRMDEVFGKVASYMDRIGDQD